MADMKNGHRWLTIAEACQMLSVSERTLRRHIAHGKYESRLQKGRRLVRLSEDDNRQMTDSQPADVPDLLVAQLQSEIQHLRDVVSKRDTQIEALMTEFAQSNQQRDQASQRSDTIVLQLTQQLEGSQKQLAQSRSRKPGRAMWRLFTGNR